MILRELWKMIRTMPDVFADWCDRQVMRLHEMVDVGEPGCPEPWCLHCDAPWPCDPYMHSSDRFVGGQSWQSS